MLQPLRLCCVKCVIHHERDVREGQHHTYMWREQAIIEWSWHVNSIVACCHGAKLCTHAARDFRSQQKKLPKIIHTINNLFIHCLRFVSLGHKVFTKLIFGLCSKKIGNHCLKRCWCCINSNHWWWIIYGKPKKYSN